MAAKSAITKEEISLSCRAMAVKRPWWVRQSTSPKTGQRIRRHAKITFCWSFWSSSSSSTSLSKSFTSCGCSSWASTRMSSTVLLHGATSTIHSSTSRKNTKSWCKTRRPSTSPKSMSRSSSTPWSLGSFWISTWFSLISSTEKAWSTRTRTLTILAPYFFSSSSFSLELLSWSCLLHWGSVHKARFAPVTTSRTGTTIQSIARTVATLWHLKVILLSSQWFTNLSA